jgi:hypothetical protein
LDLELRREICETEDKVLEEVCEEKCEDECKGEKGAEGADKQ